VKGTCAYIIIVDTIIRHHHHSLFVCLFVSLLIPTKHVMCVVVGGVAVVSTNTSSGGFYNRITGCLSSLSLLFPNRLRVVEHDFGDRTKFRQWLVEDGFRNNFQDASGKAHVACPIVWFATSSKEGTPDPADIEKYLGGHDATIEWCRDFMQPRSSDCDKPQAMMVNDGHTSDHGYDYDLVVIGTYIINCRQTGIWKRKKHGFYGSSLDQCCCMVVYLPNWIQTKQDSAHHYYDFY
jgi:hypothetical protein